MTAGVVVGTNLLGLKLALIGLVSLLTVLFVKPPPAIVIVFALLLQMSSATEYARASPGFSVTVRVSVVILCLVLLANQAARHRRRLSALAAAWACGTAAFFWVGAVAEVSIPWLLGMVGLTVTAIALGVVAHNVPPKTIGISLDVALIVSYLACYLSVLAGVLTPVEGGRLEGVFANANTLGFLASLGAVRFVVSQDRRLRLYVVLTLAMPAVLWTASRAAAAAFVAAVVVAALYSILLRRGHGKRILGAVLVVGAVLGAWLVQSVGTEASLLRTNDSRADGVTYALSIAESTNGLGQGYEEGAVEIASTPLRWLADGGYVGLSLVLAAYVAVLLCASRLGWRAVLVAVFGVAHSTLEGWYFSGGSLLFFSHWLAFFSATSLGGARRQKANSSAQSDVRRAV